MEREVGCVRAVRKVVGGVRAGNLLVEMASAVWRYAVVAGWGVVVEV